ncbi:MAG: DUF2271 domain-containing protein [Pseudomonadota bacterium]
MLKFLIGAALAVVVAPMSVEAEPFQRRHENVLGASLDIIVHANEEDVADSAEEAVLAEIARLNALLSTYLETSEVSRLNAAERMVISPELIEVLSACEAFRETTENALSCRIGELVSAWREAEATDTVPSRPELRVLAGEIRRAAVEIDVKSKIVARPYPVQFETNALAKGYIIDAAIDAAKLAAPEMSGLLVNIGGDLRTWGDTGTTEGWRAVIPGREGDTVVRLSEAALATSGVGPRDRVIDGKSFSHIVSPTSGWPTSKVAEVSVYAPDAMTADALATAFAVMRLKASLRLIETMPNTEASITMSDGYRHQSSGWSALQVDAPAKADAAWPDDHVFAVSFEIPEIDVADYEQPYIAAWIADPDRNLIRILLLAGEESRWMEENYYWHRRFGRKAGSLVTTVSEPTRRPGRYSLTWDGLNHRGETAAHGDYILHVEAAREYGGHQHERIAFTLSDASIKQDVLAGDELGEIQLRLGMQR